MESEMIFVDANALADFFVGLPELRSDAENLRRKFPDWMTLPLCRYEFGNVLRTYARLGRIGEEDAMLMLRQGLRMVAFCGECDAEEIFAEANTSNLTFYDAAYVARARSLGVRLFTRDGAILDNCPEVGVPISGA